MTFLELTTTELDRELGTADRTQRFTLARRRAAINTAQLEFVERTECLARQGSLPLSAAQEYDLEAYFDDLAWLGKSGVSILIVTAAGAATVTLSGPDFQLTTIARLDAEEPGWRGAAAGRPRKWYVRRDGGALKLGLYPKPSIGSGETWTALVDYVVIVADMSADDDEPFSVNGNPAHTLRPYHRALAHFAAYDLEKLRKDLARGSAQLQLFESYVQRYLGRQRPEQGQQVRYARDYRAGTARRLVRGCRGDVRV